MRLVHVGVGAACLLGMFAAVLLTETRLVQFVRTQLLARYSKKHTQEGDGQFQRPEVRKEDLTQATNKLGLTGPPKSKTIQVMEECGEFLHSVFTERSGTAAPSVFGGRKSGTDTRAAPAVRK
ncbi:hypothetical protein fugu_005211 [Takifugu bimaculatus]|uniref:Musculoskeletal embryonic nuclear protein 1 n=1 Tax=Takifugu bimaculatus TaxID=433685 RepID=A0A4Z2BAF8_9TELE|nr:hypothetical protein fugu_005211 [Takifugu bimaculatus]